LLLTGLLALAAPGLAHAGDRHVFLDTDGDGYLNDCPNPDHNAAGVSGTAPLRYCESGGGRNGKVIGAASGRVSAAECTSDPGGVVRTAVNGTEADVDGDGAPEPLYGHPQACVWNMARSDSCEVHAGTYHRPGAECDEDCGNQSPAGLEGTPGVCDKFDCFRASVVAFGDGPNLDGSGYGTAAEPGYLRAAVMSGSIDTWDPDGDKDPADGFYPAILSGDSNGNGSFDVTACSGNQCSGDAFYGVIIGCGGRGFARHFCRTNPEAGSTYVRIDSDADGTTDRDVGVFQFDTREVHHLQIKDLTFTRYNGGNGGIEGTRPKGGTFDLNGGDGSTDGLVVEHIYLHDNDFTYGLDDVSEDRVENEGYTENHWAAFVDHTNPGCTKPTEIRDSFLVQNNARLLNFDCSGNYPCGCEIDFHDNRVVVDVDPAKVPTYVDPGGRERERSIVIGYYKNIGANPQQHRIRNNEFIIKNMGNSRGYFMDLQSFGDGEGSGDGELWIYGNLFRHDPSVGFKMKRFWQAFCDGGGSVNGGTESWKLYLFSNSFDMDIPLENVCGGQPGELLVERNNAFLRMTDLYLSSADTVIRSHNAASTSSSNRAVWFDPGRYAAGDPGYHDGPANYSARENGPLDGTGSCDPDGDGAAGVDYDWDGSPETAWVDLAGKTIDCSGANAVMDIGAVQSGSDSGPPDTTPPADVVNFRRTDIAP
jgi:hypothetical protein